MAARQSFTLRAIPGGLHREIQIAGLRAVVGPEDRPPFPVEARVFEEDTYLVLSAPVEVTTQPEHPIRLMTALWNLKPKLPGTILVRSGRPLRLLAVIHDLNQNPSWRESWIAQALMEILQEVNHRRLSSLALPFLGAVHGRLPPERFLNLLGEALHRHPPSTLRHLWLVETPKPRGHPRSGPWPAPLRSLTP